MDNQSLVLVGILFCAVFVFWLGRHLAKRKIIAKRRPLSFEEIHKLTNSQVSLHTLTRVFTMMGDCYRINPQLIRPEDRLKQLFDLDSWTLGLGTERVNTWLAEEGVTASGDQIVTILDLLHFVEQYGAEVIPSSSTTPLQ